MKILIKSQPTTYHSMNKEHLMNHVSGYWNFLHRRIWEKQGHDVKFIGSKEQLPDIITNYNDADFLFFRGLNSFKENEEFSQKLLKEFKGTKILYLEAGRDWPWLNEFDCIITPEIISHYNIYKERFPNVSIELMPWTCPEFELLDKNLENPYIETHSKIIFTGIYNNRYLDSMKYLASKGLHIYLGGIYFDETICRASSKEEINCSNIHLITEDGIFKFGTKYNYIRHADLAIGYYSANFEGGLSSKIVEYLSLGCSVIAENTIPNRYRVIQCNAGSIVNYDNKEELYHHIIKELNNKRDKNEIMKRARNIFNPETICENILKLRR